MDQLVSEAARLRYRSGAEFTAPITVRMPAGGGIHGGQTHSQSPESLFTHVCGLKTVMPSTPYDAKGLLIAAIEDDDPVIFLEPKRLYNGPFDGHHERPVVPWSAHPLGEVPDGYYHIPLGEATVRREGGDVTVLAYGTMVYVAEAAADETGVDAEIIDLRTLLPLDTDTIERSVRKTGRCVDRPRGDADERLRRRAVGGRAGAVLLPPRGADRAGHRVGHAVPARPGVGLLPRPGTGRQGAAPGDGRRAAVSDYVIRLPDVGEGVAEAEIVEWHVNVGDTISEDDVLAEVMTDKATVELPSPVHGIVRWLGAEVGDIVAVGCRHRPHRDRHPPPSPSPAAAPAEAPNLPNPWPNHRLSGGHGQESAARLTRTGRGRRRRRRRRRCGRGRRGWGSTSPSVAAAGRTGGSCTTTSTTCSPDSPARRHRSQRDGDDEVEEIKIVGLRRNIAERMQASKRRIPHFTYVEEVDVTALEELRAEVNDGRPANGCRCCRS